MCSFVKLENESVVNTQKLNSKIIIIISSLVIITACSSAPRFTKDNDVSGTRYKSGSSVLIGTASYYADEFHGRKTANGEIYDMYKLTAAHIDLPFGTILKVTNMSNNKSVNVRINDRMPEFKNRLIDLSYGAAKEISMIKDGTAKVKIEIIRLGK